jgi:hypothetical protein
MQLFILYICYGVEGLTGLIGLLRFKKLNQPLRILEYYILFCLVVGLFELCLARHHIHNLWLLHINDPVELILLVFVLYGWKTSIKYGRYLIGSFALYFFIWVIGLFTFEPIYETTTYTSDIMEAIQIIFGTWLLMIILGDEQHRRKNDARFWAVSGIVLYAASTIVLFGLFNVMLKNLPAQVMINLWLINLVSIIICHLFFLRAFLCKPESALETDNENIAGTVV